MRGVIFDCDGVLVASERLVNRIESEHLQRLGLSITPEETRARFKGKTVSEVASDVETMLGRPAPAEWIHDWGWWTALGAIRELQPVPGVASLVERLDAAGVPIAVASQSPLPRVQLCLQVTGLARYFHDRVLTASMVSRPKPAPDLFLLAADCIGVDPISCVVIEDSPSGVRAARAAGMLALGYAGDEDPHILSAAGAETFMHMEQILERLIAAGVCGAHG